MSTKKNIDFLLVNANITLICKQIGLFVLISLYLIFGCAAQLICNSIGLVYPAYVSIKALETSSKDDDTKWLTYWVIYAMFSVIEFFSDFLVSWFPLYWFAKCVFLVWLMVPTSFNGSSVLYRQFVQPYFVRHHKKVDKAVSSISAKVIEPIRDIASDAFKSD